MVFNNIKTTVIFSTNTEQLSDHHPLSVAPMCVEEEEEEFQIHLNYCILSTRTAWCEGEAYD